MSTAILEMPTLTPTRNAAAPAGLDRIVLTGFMGSGKSTVGALLAERLGWKFFDLDAEIERREGMSVPAIFANMGEMRFRRAEAAAPRAANAVLCPRGNGKSWRWSPKATKTRKWLRRCSLANIP